MKKLLLLSLFFLGAIEQVKSQDLNLIVKPRPADFEYLSSPDSLGIREQLLMPNLGNRNISAEQKLPYPIIFIHGLNSSSAVWIDLGNQLINRGLSSGGRIDFCLNDNGNNQTSNKNVWTNTNNNIPAADIALYTSMTDLTVADFYLLNFNVDNFGRSPSNPNFTDVLSNEAAIVKQGVALKIAIQMVLLKTGRDKVILMGHSMGGLAAREYIQNPINWQPDGNHHVAKLITTGTPHGGFTGINASPATGIDEKSEAYRDLKKSYTVSGNNGVYLYGGNENYSTMNNNLLYDFYNVDVNCNSVDADNSYVVGLNEKSLSLNLDYAYIVGHCTNCFLLQGLIQGDGIVRSENANLKNFYTLPSPRNEFIYTASAINLVIGLHSDLPKAITVNLQALDEPNQLWLAYGVDYNITYKGFIYNQPDNGYTYDYDDYKFTVTNNSIVNIFINNISSTTLFARIFDINGIQIGTTYSGNSSNPINITNSLLPGEYYLEIYGTPVDLSIINSYNFNLSSTLSSEDFVLENSIKVYPNPFSNNLTIEANEPILKVEIYNMLGQLVKSKTSQNLNENLTDIELSELAQGNYLAKIYTEANVKFSKIIKK